MQKKSIFGFIVFINLNDFHFFLDKACQMICVFVSRCVFNTFAEFIDRLTPCRILAS
jgi:hypothetical protein